MAMVQQPMGAVAKAEIVKNLPLSIGAEVKEVGPK
jgi:hypothetical protein